MTAIIALAGHRQLDAAASESPVISPLSIGSACCCRSLEELEAQLGGADRLAAFKGDFLAALVESLAGSSRFDAEGQRVLTSPTVLNVVATA